MMGWGRLLRLPRSLGRRLILAFVSITVLTCVMGMAAYMVWGRLGQQVAPVCCCYWHSCVIPGIR
ncbi:hypothetical protein WP9W18E04_00320 [Aeromonas veronii]|nr:hypothetical protein WP9W18E04_00320 [Aeromonas veronii]